MPRKVTDEKRVTIADARKVLEKAKQEELRAILAVKGLVIPIAQLDDVLKVINNHRKEEASSD
jgi:DNA-directed RNA polymerase subunit F